MSVPVEFEQAAQVCRDVLDTPLGVGSAAEAAQLLAAAEQLRRLASVAVVSALETVEQSGAHYDHGHASAKVMTAHVNRLSGRDAAALNKTRRMIAACDVVAGSWSAGELSLDHAALLGRVWANRRVRAAFEETGTQEWFVSKAKKSSFKRFERAVTGWMKLHDQDGPEPAADPSHERRDLSITQDSISGAWHLRGVFGSVQGARIEHALRGYTQAEFATDWEQAKATHGDDVSTSDLARTAAQRRADAFEQVCADALNSTDRSAPIKTVHNIVWSADTFEAALARWTGGAAKIVHPDRHRCSTLDGDVLNVDDAFADLLHSSVRRVVQSPAKTTVEMSDARLFVGLTRLGVELSRDECYWPGCHIRITDCQIDHLRPAARGGPTSQLNGAGACRRHNRLKEAGYTATRDPESGSITITTPAGDTLIVDP